MSKLTKEKKWAGRLRELVTNDNEFLKLAEFLDGCDSTEFSYQVNRLASIVDPVNYHPTFKDALDEYMDFRDITIAKLQKALGVDKRGYEDICECVTDLTKEQALAIACLFELRSDTFWLELQKTYKKKNHSNTVLYKRSKLPKSKINLDRDRGIW